MNEAATSLSQFEAPPEHRVRLGIRCLVYFSVWLFAALAFQIFLQPEGPTESDFTPLQQRLLWPLYTPLMAVVGLTQAITSTHRYPDWAPWVVAAGFGLHFIAAMAQGRRSSFAALTCIQVLFLTVAVIYFVRQSYGPTGG